MFQVEEGDEGVGGGRGAGVEETTEAAEKGEEVGAAMGESAVTNMKAVRPLFILIYYSLPVLWGGSMFSLTTQGNLC